MKGFSIIIMGVLLLQLSSCRSHSSSELRNALTFYASFDKGTTADFALGGPDIYTAHATYVNSSRNLEGIQVGMNNTDHSIIQGEGQFGNAFQFGEKSDTVLFYKSKDNITYNPQNWSGTISFWLRVDPSTELTGYTDPIQITDTNFNDASIWVDFTDKAPKDFRLGVIGDKAAWTLDTLNSPVKAVFEKRLVSTKASYFTKDNWTHILITYDGLGTVNSRANLYLNGKKVGLVSGIDDPFTWELEKSNIFLGLNFSGLMDELAIFNKPLTDKEAMELYQLKGGIKSIL
ncbi:MAG: LamG domain-containing protein [Roseivirga sp.]|nr:LamG domain-containing protein [Roseivirga sp.]